MNTPPYRTRQFHIRLSDEELSQMHARARDAGCSLSRFVRDCGISGKVVSIPAVNREQWSYLAGTTANLNQLVRLCNQGVLPPSLDATVLETSRLLREVRSRLLGKN